MAERTVASSITEVRGGRRAPGEDQLAAEEPLEIRVRADGDFEQSLTITMRTPGDDAELAVGFLFTEGLLRGRADVAGGTSPAPEVVVVDLAPGAPRPEPRQARAFATTSACGVCGRGSL